MDDIRVNEFYERREDMSPDGKLSLIMQEDGDIIISIFGKGRMHDRDQYCTVAVEFCTSGGRSHHTRMALRALMVAIEKDNTDAPIEIDNPYLDIINDITEKP